MNPLLSGAMALELARHGMRVNALAPGYVETVLNHDFLASDAGRRLMARIPQRRFIGGRAQAVLAPGIADWLEARNPPTKKSRR